MVNPIRTTTDRTISSFNETQGTICFIWHSVLAKYSYKNETKWYDSKSVGVVQFTHAIYQFQSNRCILGNNLKFHPLVNGHYHVLHTHLYFTELAWANEAWPASSVSKHFNDIITLHGAGFTKGPVGRGPGPKIKGPKIMGKKERKKNKERRKKF